METNRPDNRIKRGFCKQYHIVYFLPKSGKSSANQLRVNYSLDNIISNNSKLLPMSYTQLLHHWLSTEFSWEQVSLNFERIEESWHSFPYLGFNGGLNKTLYLSTEHLKFLLYNLRFSFQQESITFYFCFA